MSDELRDDLSVSNEDEYGLEASGQGSLETAERRAQLDAQASAEAGGAAGVEDVTFEELAALPAFLSTIDEAEEVVIGDDDRTRIDPATDYPWRAICSLQIAAKDGTSWIGTGWFIGHRTLITAGHCVYMHDNGGWPASVRVIPGRNAADQPFGSAVATRVFSTRGWVESRRRTFDYGAIVLPEASPLGAQLGWFGYANYGFGKLHKAHVNLSGYPGDKGGDTQWWHSREIKSVMPRVLTYDIDTAGGQSGAPVWRVVDGSTYAVGIHTNGHQTGNSATRIESSVYRNLTEWRAKGQ